MRIPHSCQPRNRNAKCAFISDDLINLLLSLWKAIEPTQTPWVSKTLSFFSTCRKPAILGSFQGSLLSWTSRSCRGADCRAELPFDGNKSHFSWCHSSQGIKKTDPKANVWTSWGKDPGSGLCVLEGQDLGLWAGVLIIQSAAACPSAMGNKHPGKHVLCLYPWPLLLQWSMKLLGSAWCWSVCKAIFCSHSFSCSLVKEHIWKSSLPYPCKGKIFMKTHRNLTIAEILISCHAWLKPASSFKSFCMGSTWPCTICFHRKPSLSKPQVVLSAFAEDDISSLVPFSWSSLEVAELLYSLFFLVFPKVLIWSIWICLQAAVFLQKAMVASVPGNTGIISSKEKAKSSSKKAWNMYSLKCPSGM